MTNHVHLVLVPQDSACLGKALRRAHGEYARWLHIRLRQSGHLWQNRYFSCPLDESHLWQALAYVERNPVRASLVEAAEDWFWSSARVHLAVSTVEPAGIVDVSSWRERWDSDRWRIALDEGLVEADLRSRLQAATSTGRPLGDPEFVRICERIAMRPLTRQKPGPKKKNRSAMGAGAEFVRRGVSGSSVPSRIKGLRQVPAYWGVEVSVPGTGS